MTPPRVGAGARYGLGAHPGLRPRDGRDDGGVGHPERPGTLKRLPTTGGKALDTLFKSRIILRPIPGRNAMAWKTPSIVEIAVGMEINTYACADL